MTLNISSFRYSFIVQSSSFETDNFTDDEAVKMIIINLLSSATADL